MASSPKLFEISQQDDIVIVTAMRDLSEFVYEALESEAADVLALLKGEHCRSVVFDLSPTDYCGSTALGCGSGGAVCGPRVPGAGVVGA